jgi:hypothetical protein
MKATLTAEFLEGIPLSIRQRLHLRPGTVMEFDEEVPYLKAVPAAPEADELAQFQTWLDESTGQAAGKPATDERLAETRREMMSCIGVARGKGPLGEMSSSEWLEAARGPVELPQEA